MSTVHFLMGEVTSHRCDNCDIIWPGTELEPMPDFEQRVDPGNPCPSGECPACHALCYPVPAEADQPVSPEPAKTEHLGDLTAEGS